MLLFSIHMNSPVTTRTLQYLLCATRYICYVLQLLCALYFCIQCYYYHTKKLYQSKIYSNCSSIFFQNVTIQPIQNFLELKKFLAIMLDIMANKWQLNWVHTCHLWISRSPPFMRRRSDVSFRSCVGGDVVDHGEMSLRLLNWYVNETELFETLQRRTNWYLSETDKLNMWERAHNWYLNETHMFETLQQHISWYFKDTEPPRTPRKFTALHAEDFNPFQWLI